METFEQVIAQSLKNNKRVLLCGERHYDSLLPGLIEILKDIENKNIIVAVEDTDVGEAYNDKNLPMNNIRYHKDYKKLLSQNIKVYGLESERSNPVINFTPDKDTNIEELLEVVKELPIEETTKEAVRSMAQKNGNNALLIAAMEYNNSPARITQPNDVFANKISDLCENNPEDLIIVCVGAAHIPAVKCKGNSLDSGLLNRIINFGINVDAYNVSKQTCDDYTPTDSDPNIKYGTIKNAYNDVGDKPAVNANAALMSNSDVREFSYHKNNSNPKSQRNSFCAIS